MTFKWMQPGSVGNRRDPGRQHDFELQEVLTFKNGLREKKERGYFRGSRVAERAQGPGLFHWGSTWCFRGHLPLH